MWYNCHLQIISNDINKLNKFYKNNINNNLLILSNELPIEYIYTLDYELKNYWTHKHYSINEETIYCEECYLNNNTINLYFTVKWIPPINWIKNINYIYPEFNFYFNCENQLYSFNIIDNIITYKHNLPIIDTINNKIIQDINLQIIKGINKKNNIQNLIVDTIHLNNIKVDKYILQECYIYVKKINIAINIISKFYKKYSQINKFKQIIKSIILKNKIIQNINEFGLIPPDFNIDEIKYIIPFNNHTLKIIKYSSYLVKESQLHFYSNK